MRPLGLFLAACLCAALLHGRVSNPFLPAVLAAAPAPIAKSPPREETRLERLQHYALACQILAKEETEAAYLGLDWKDYRYGFANHIAYTRCSKELRATWDRITDKSKADEWEEELKRLPPEKQAAARDQEDKNNKEIEKKRLSYHEAIKVPSGAASKDFETQLEESPRSKKLRFAKEIVRRLTREQQETRAALLGD